VGLTLPSEHHQETSDPDSGDRSIKPFEIFFDLVFAFT